MPCKSCEEKRRRMQELMRTTTTTTPIPFIKQVEKQEVKEIIKKDG